MARRRNNGLQDLVLNLIMPLGGVVILLCAINPGLRHTLVWLGTIALMVFILAIIGLVIYKLVSGRRQTDSPFVEGQISAYQPTLPPPVNSRADLVQKLHAIDWFQFEKIIALVCADLGFSVTRRGGANPDGGIDLVLESNGERKAVQCKQWKAWKVGIKPVREFYGAMMAEKFEKGIYITLRGYTPEAKEFADKFGIEFMDEAGVAQMIEMSQARYSPEFLELINDSRKFCPKCEAEMVLRTATKGMNRGGQFWGCSSYPRCKYTLQIN